MEFSYVLWATALALLLLFAARRQRSRGRLPTSSLSSQPAAHRDDPLKSQLDGHLDMQLYTQLDLQLDTQLKHLTSRISLLAAEGYGYHGIAAEKPNSPNDPVPFGHLADAWITFVCAVQPQDDVWMVKIPQGETITRLGVPLSDDAHGFAIVRQGRVVHEFFYQRH